MFPIDFISYAEMLSCLDSLRPILDEDGSFNLKKEKGNIKILNRCFDTPDTVTRAAMSNDNNVDTAIISALNLAKTAAEMQKLSAVKQVDVFRKIYREYKGYSTSEPRGDIFPGFLIAGAMLGGLVGRKIGMLGVGLLMSSLIGIGFGVGLAVVIERALNNPADKKQKLIETRNARKKEFEGYMTAAGLDNVMQEFRRSTKRP